MRLHMGMVRDTARDKPKRSPARFQCCPRSAAWWRLGAPCANHFSFLLRKLLSKYNMEQFVTKEKLGFNVNTINLWYSYGKKLCNKYLSNANIVNDCWINSDWINKYIDKDDLDVRYINKFLGLLSLEIWYRLFITKDISKETKLC